jgi:hypothetical protein
MAFNTSSFLAGVGSVVVVLSAGFAGGYMLGSPNHVNPPNRLQRVAADIPDSKTVTPVAAAAAAKLQVVADAQPSSVAAQPAEASAPQPVAVQITAKPEVKTETQPSAAAPVETTLPTNTENAKPQMSAIQPAGTDRTYGDRGRAAEARRPDNSSAENKAVEKKRSDIRKYAEQQRKQRELEVATVAVRRIIHDRNAQEVVDDDRPEAPAPAAPYFSLFGQE